MLAQRQSRWAVVALDMAHDPSPPPLTHRQTERYYYVHVYTRLYVNLLKS